MDRIHSTPKPTTRFSRGAVVLSNAELIDTKSIGERLDAFSKAHRSYIEAQTQVDEAKSAYRTEAERVLRLDGEVNHAMQDLALCLAVDGESRRDPFERFSDLGPGRIEAMASAEKARQVHAVAVAIQNDAALSEQSHAKGQVVDTLASRLDEAAAGAEMRREYLRRQRKKRNTLGRAWDQHFLALRYSARSALEAPGLFDMLFEGVDPPRKSPESITPAATSSETQPASA
jgi:hypothetical protein